jgi:hypothetical protein
LVHARPLWRIYLPIFSANETNKSARGIESHTGRERHVPRDTEKIQKSSAGSHNAAAVGKAA